MPITDPDDASLPVYPGALHDARRPENGCEPRDRQRRESAQGVPLMIWTGAADFTADPRGVGDYFGLLREFKRHRFHIELEELVDEERLSGRGPIVLPPGVRRKDVREPGRQRDPGIWSLALLAWRLSGQESLLKWYMLFSGSGIWTEILEFESIPDYGLVELRFSELERYWRAFQRMAATLIRIAKNADGRVGRFVTGDSTQWRSRASLVHCCDDVEACLRRLGDAAPNAMRSASAKEVLGARQREEQLPPDEFIRRGREYQRSRGDLIEVEGRGGRKTQYRMFYVKKGGEHVYRCLDIESGLRMYEGKTTWLGGYDSRLVDAFVGLSVAAISYRADIQEYDSFPELDRQALEALGERPLVWGFDSGWAFSDAGEFLTRRDGALVTERRGQPADRTKLRRQWFDEDGIPYCRYCGGRGDQDSPGLGLFFTEAGDPYIRFRCLTPLDDRCRGQQRVPCSHGWLALLPLSRLTELYHAVRYVRGQYERTFNHTRLRYATSGKDARAMWMRGVSPQRLAAQASLILDWFRVCLRVGWITSIELPVEPFEAAPERISGIQDRCSGELRQEGKASGNLRDTIVRRLETDAHLPFGPNAEAALARHGIPS